MTPAVFVSDRFSIGERVTVDAGVRFDHNRAINPDLPVISADGYETDAVNPGVGTIYTQNVLSPRLGVTAKLDRSGRTLLRASYGRFNQGVLTGELDPISQGITPTTTMAYRRRPGATPNSCRPSIRRSTSRSIRHAHTAYRRILGGARSRDRSAVRASVAYIRKDGEDFIGWIDTGRPVRRGNADDCRRHLLPVFALTNAAGDRRFFLTNPDRLFVQLRRFGRRPREAALEQLAGVGFLTYSRAYGLQVMSNGAADGSAVQHHRPPGLPDIRSGSERPHECDRPVAQRSAARVPRDLGGRACHGKTSSWRPTCRPSAGSPGRGRRQWGCLRAAEGCCSNRAGLAASRRSRCSTSACRRRCLGAAGSVDLILDVLNVLGDSAEEALVSDVCHQRHVWQPPRLFIDPRRAMFGVRLNLGR